MSFASEVANFYLKEIPDKTEFYVWKEILN